MKPRKPMDRCSRCEHRKHGKACRALGEVSATTNASGRCLCTHRSAPRKPLPARNVKRRPADRAVAQREAVMDRDHGLCQLLTVTTLGYRLLQCLDSARDTAHVVRRSRCGDAAYLSDVAVAACRSCHRRYDRREGVVAPQAARLRCFLAIRHAEVKRILSAPDPKNAKVVPVDLSEILPAGTWSAANQYDLVERARSATSQSDAQEMSTP
jgi:5-methylcytosine-specific restriction endonuclease McrA